MESSLYSFDPPVCQRHFPQLPSCKYIKELRKWSNKTTSGVSAKNVTPACVASRRHSRKCLRPNHTSWSTSFTNIIISHSEQPIWIVQLSSYDLSRMQRDAYQYKKNLNIKFKYCIINQGLIRSIWRCWKKTVEDSGPVISELNIFLSWMSSLFSKCGYPSNCMKTYAVSTENAWHVTGWPFPWEASIFRRDLSSTKKTAT